MDKISETKTGGNMNNTDYKDLSRTLMAWVAGSIIYYNILYNLGENLPRYVVVDLFMLFIFPMA